MTKPSLYRLMFSADIDRSACSKLNEAGASAFGELLGILSRGQDKGAFRKQPVRCQAAAAWSLLHGFTMLVTDGQLETEKFAAKPIDAVLTTMLEGLQI